MRPKPKPTKYPEVEVIDVSDKDKTTIKGIRYFEQDALYPKNISITAPTNAGKTQLMQTALLKTIGKGTECVFLFCNTAASDPLWVEVSKRIEKITRLVTFDGFVDEKGTSNLEATTKVMLERVEAIRRAEEEQEQPVGHGGPQGVILFNGKPLPPLSGAKKPPPERKPKVRVPRFVAICDDLNAQDLRSKPLYTALKHARHMQCQWYLLSQSMVSTLPMTVSQLQWMCLGGGYSSRQLKALYDKFQFGLEFDVLDALYWMVTRFKYQFLCIDLRKNRLFVNFTPVEPSALPEN